MKLNIDCIRDILLTVESYEYDEIMRFNQFCTKLPTYSAEEISYTCNKLYEAGYLEAIVSRSLRSPMPIIVEIRDLTFQGHEFLNTIREDSNWAKTKEIAKKTSIASLKGLAQIAEGVATAAITAVLQSHQG